MQPDSPGTAEPGERKKGLQYHYILEIILANYDEYLVQTGRVRGRTVRAEFRHILRPGAYLGVIDTRNGKAQSQ